MIRSILLLLSIAMLLEVIALVIVSTVSVWQKRNVRSVKGAVPVVLAMALTALGLVIVAIVVQAS